MDLTAKLSDLQKTIDNQRACISVYYLEIEEVKERNRELIHDSEQTIVDLNKKVRKVKKLIEQANQIEP